jgi:PAT family beta-lactamase induction signal transducer AmpG
MEHGRSSPESRDSAIRSRLIVSIGLLGFVSGLPNVLLNDTLSAWLSDLGFSPKDIGWLSLITLPYGLKLLWAPLLDRFAAPGFAWLGARRSWIALFSILLAIAFALLGWVGPESAAVSVLPAAVIGFAIAALSATLDAAVDAHRTDAASGGEEGPAASAYVLGFRVAFVSIGAAILMLHGRIALLFGPEGDVAARALGWRVAVAAGGAAMLLGVLAAALAPEPARQGRPTTIRQAVVEPLVAFVRAFGPRIAVVLFVALLFRLPDLLGNRMTMPFLRQELGFSVEAIGTIRQFLGFGMTILGAVVGGVLVKRWGLFRALVVFGVLQIASNAGYLFLEAFGRGETVWAGVLPGFGVAPQPLFVPRPSLAGFAGLVIVENLCNGLVSAAFVAYFMTICEPRLAAAQYAILSGLMYLASSLVASTSGLLVEQLGYQGFFLVSIMVGIPPLLALPWAMPRLSQAGSEP